MPEILANFLVNLSDKDAEVLYEYFDSTPCVELDVLDTIALSHDNVFVPEPWVR